MKIAISADTSIDLTKEIIEANSIHTIPFEILLGDKQGYDGEITCDEIIAFVDETNILPKTAAVNQFRLEEYFEELKKKFKPEFINRIDVISVFKPLNNEDLTKIAKILISNINNRLLKQNLELKITEEALALVVEKGCKNKEFGARPLKRYIQQEIEDTIAEKILLGELQKSGVVIIDMENNKLTFESE